MNDIIGNFTAIKITDDKRKYVDLKKKFDFGSEQNEGMYGKDKQKIDNKEVTNEKKDDDFDFDDLGVEDKDKEKDKNKA